MSEDQPKPSAWETLPRYEYVMYRIIGIASRICGVGVMFPNYRPSALTAFCAVVCFLDLVFCLYTMTMFSTEVAIKSFTNFAFTIQGLCKLFSYLWGAPKILQFVEYLKGLYVINNSPSAPFYDVFERCGRTFVRFVKFGVAMYVFVVASFVANTLLLFVFTGDMVPIFEIYIPGVDITEPRGFLVSSMLHAVNGVFACVGSVAADFAFIIIAAHLWPMCVIFERYVGSLDKDLRRTQGKRWTLQMQLKWRNIMLVHQEIVKYTEDVFKHYYVFASMELYNNQYLMVVLLYCMLTMNWPPGVLFLVLLTGRLLMYCILGTFIDTLNQRIYAAFQQSLWYLLPLQNQRQMATMIQKAQRPQTLSAGLVPLNFTAFVDVLQTVYSVTMLLLRTL